MQPKAACAEVIVLLFSWSRDTVIGSECVRDFPVV